MSGALTAAYADSSAVLAIARGKGAGKVQHTNSSSLWIQEKQDLHPLGIRKVLGTENPADALTKYLTGPHFTCIALCWIYVEQT